MVKYIPCIPGLLQCTYQVRTQWGFLLYAVCHAMFGVLYPSMMQVSIKERYIPPCQLNTP